MEIKQQILRPAYKLLLWLALPSIYSFLFSLFAWINFAFFYLRTIFLLCYSLFSFPNTIHCPSPPLHPIFILYYSSLLLPSNNCSTYYLLTQLANSVRKIAFLSLPFSNKLFHLLPIDEIGKFNQKICILSLPFSN